MSIFSSPGLAAGPKYLTSRRQPNHILNDVQYLLSAAVDQNDMLFTKGEVLLIKIQPFGEAIEAFQSGHCLTTQFYKVFSDCCFSRFMNHKFLFDNDTASIR